MTHYNTLDAALEDIAKRSFYENAMVTPGEGGYAVADDYATSFHGDGLLWDDVSGVDWPAHADDHSRLHDDADYYETAKHIRYNLSSAVEALEEGQAVTFAYATVDAVACDVHAYPEECECDRSAGWALLAAIHDN